LHPAYQLNTADDVPFCDAAVIKVDRPFIFNHFVRKVKLPPHDYEPKGIKSYKVEIKKKNNFTLELSKPNGYFLTICFCQYVLIN
jgi:hypothetical protein